jgi:hypothetical protein
LKRAKEGAGHIHGREAEKVKESRESKNNFSI